MKICKGCKREYSDGIWLHEELGICSICYSVHIHSTFQKFDGKQWKKKSTKDITDFL